MDVTKRCPRCGKEKPVEDFVRNRSAKDGLGSYCKPCHNRVIKEQKQKLYGGERSFLLMLRYGISEVEFEQLRKRQRGMCAICRKRAAKPSIMITSLEGCARFSASIATVGWANSGTTQP